MIIGHEPNALVHAVIRKVGDRFHLTERHRSSTYSEADDSTSGLDLDRIERVAENAGLNVVTVLPHWYLFGIVYNTFGVISNLKQSPFPIPSALSMCAIGTDKAIRRIPLINKLAFFFSMVLQKSTES